MEVEQVLDITRESIKIALLLSSPILVLGLVTGVVINIFQAVTQITESTLTVVPKLLVMVVALLLFSPWMIDLMTDFTFELYSHIPTLVR